MKSNEYNVKGIKITIMEKPEFEAVGFTRPVNLDGGMIYSFINELSESGQINKLVETLNEPQQIWVCLSDVGCSPNNTYCKVCDLSCSGFQTRCTVCVKKTEKHDFSKFAEAELFTLCVPASEWALYEMNDKQSAENLHVYEMVKEIGYEWNTDVRLHLDNEHECYHDGDWNFDEKSYYFLLPVIKNTI
ncbi:MAG: hypothetical protein FWF15_04260 [Oscillospiraceae bacterium]|nr:hypothetical protein [Oscillospiraceae bacterium]